MAEEISALFPESAYHNLFGLHKEADIAFAEQISGALQRIDRGLLPPSSGHPLGALIARGVEACDELLASMRDGNPQQRDEAADALAHVLLYAEADQAVLWEIRDLLQKAEDPEWRATLAKCLAIGRDQAFLRTQMEMLADEDPGLVATAARLIGMGRYRPALPLLIELVSPERIYESRFVIWALGEIGDASALRVLELSLSQGFRSVDCLIAIGKIAQPTSVAQITPLILDGLPEQRDAAYRALAMLLDRNRDLAQQLPELKDELGGLIMQQLADDKIQLSGSARFHMCLCLARLGTKLDPGTVRRYLRVDLDEDEAGGMASYFMSRTGKK